MKANFWLNKFGTLSRSSAAIATIWGIITAYKLNLRQPAQAEE